MIFGFSISFIITFLIMPIIIRFASKRRVGDWYQSHSIHNSYIPTLGGVGMFLGFFIGLFTLFGLSELININVSHKLIGLFLGSCIILIEGVYDDLKGANYHKKFASQILASFIVIIYGYRIDFISNPFGSDLSLGIFTIPLTILWITGITNAVNLIDGLDGLAAGIGAIISMTFVAITYMLGDYSGFILSLLLLSTTLAFLWYNFNPAKVFMGDVGSQFIGFIIACISIDSFYNIPNSPAVFVPIIAIGVPILDTVSVFMKRIYFGRHPFKGDKNHIHHHLLNMNIGYKKTVFIFYAANLFFGISSFLLMVLSPVYIAPIIGIVCIFTVFALYKVGYIKTIFSNKD